MIMPFKVGDLGVLPTRGHSTDAGLDLYASADVVVQPGQFVDVATDVSGALPDNHWGLLVGRSSTLRTYGLLVHEGVIDQGYRGELFVGTFNLTSEPVKLSKGTRIGQLIVIPMPIEPVEPVEVSSLPEGERGTSGFGSTGA